MVLNLRKNQGMVLYVDNYKSINQLATYFQGGGLIRDYILQCLCCSCYSAVRERDYETINEVLTFGPNETRQCVNMSIINDLTMEPDEIFSLSLTTASSNTPLSISLNSTAANVVIIDDGK